MSKPFVSRQYEKLSSEALALLEAIKHFEEQIANQGMITNARDEEHLERHVLSDLTNVDSLKLQRGETNGSIESFIENPFVGKGNTEFLRVKNVNSRTGETVVSSSVVKEIDRQYE